MSKNGVSPSTERMVRNIAKKNKIKKDKKNICKYCNCDNPLIMTVDHILPKIRGGSDDDKNLDCVCFVCNKLKGGLTDPEFKKYMKAIRILKELCKLNVIVPDLQIEFKERNYPGYYEKVLKKKE